MANGTKERNTSPITILDEIDEFSEKPVQGKTLYKKLKELEDSILPDTTEASAGDALVLDDDKKPTWAASSGGGFLIIHCDGAAIVQSGGVFIPTDCTRLDVMSCFDAEKKFTKPIFVHLPALENFGTGEYSYNDNKSAVYLVKSFAQLQDDPIVTLEGFSYSLVVGPAVVGVKVTEVTAES